MRKHSQEKKRDRGLLLMSLPALVWYVLFCYIPLFGIFFAFKTFTPKPGESLFRNLFINSPWAGLKNFSFLLKSSEMSGILFNTLFYNIIFLVLGIVIPVFLAIVLAERALQPVHMESEPGESFRLRLL